MIHEEIKSKIPDGERYAQPSRNLDWRVTQPHGHAGMPPPSGGLVYTLTVIKCNLAVVNEQTDTCPPVEEVKEKLCQIFATETSMLHVKAAPESWLSSSDAGSSRHDSMSNWLFSTHHTQQGFMRLSLVTSQPSVQLKSSYWFTSPSSGTDPSIPPVPPLPSAIAETLPQLVS